MSSPNAFIGDPGNEREKHEKPGIEKLEKPGKFITEIFNKI